MARATLPLRQQDKEPKTALEIRQLVADAINGLPDAQPIAPESIAVFSDENGLGRWSIGEIGGSSEQPFSKRNAIQELQDRYRVAEQPE